MFEGFRSRWTTPAEWTYFKPRYYGLGKMGRLGMANHDLVEEVLDELLFEGSGCEETV
jgi:hypothetical protein